MLTFNTDRTVTVNNGTEIINYRLATFGPRLGARLIDVLIIIIPSFFIPLLPGWLYWSLQQCGSHQATVGQRACNIKVLSVDGAPVSFGQATGRYFGKLLNALTLGIGLLMFFFNDKNQCLHDYVSGCIVVEEINRQPVFSQP